MYSDQLYRRKGPFSGSSPDSIIGLSSYRGCLTGSSLVPTITCTSDEEELPPPVPQPASTPPATAAPAISLSASRRDIFGLHMGLCFGWNTIFTPLPLGGELPLYPTSFTSFPCFSVVGSRPNSRVAASRHISFIISPSTAESLSSICSARPSISAERYVAKRSGSQGPNSPLRWPSLTTSAMVFRQRLSRASRLRAASPLRKARDHNSTHNDQYSSVSRRSTGGQASSISRTSRSAAPSIPVSSRNASM